MGVHIRTMAVAVLVLTACSYGGGSSIPTTGNGVTQLHLTSADFKHVAVWGGEDQAAVAQCPQNYRVVAGGSSSANGDSVGTGHPNSNNTAWVVKPPSGTSAEAFATCVSRFDASHQFHWRSASPVSGLASAQCRSGYILITGYGTGAVDASWFDQSTNTYWVSGGGYAYASCVRAHSGIIIKHAWNKSQNPKNVYAGCGSGYTVIGGAMGDNAWPGPPIQQHPGIASGPGKHGYAGWWTFSNAHNELTWAACAPN